MGSTGTAVVGEGGSSVEAVRDHYDREETGTFWTHFLDSTLSYSCGKWESGDSLESAQRRKLDYMAEEAGASPGARMLDIGCGWGGCLHRMVTRHGVTDATGLTLSAEQARWMDAQFGDEFKVRVEAWEEFIPERPFDGIVSIGAFEHFSVLGMTQEEKIERYRVFFERCHAWLKPGGRMSLQTMCKGAVLPDRQGVQDYRFIMTDIFPDSDTPYIGEVAAACQGTFEITRLHNTPADYATTCREWLRRYDANEAQLRASVGDVQFDRFRRYLAASVRQFDTRIGGLARYSLRRSDRPLVSYRRTGRN